MQKGKRNITGLIPAAILLLAVLCAAAKVGLVHKLMAMAGCAVLLLCWQKKRCGAGWPCFAAGAWLLAVVYQFNILDTSNQLFYTFQTDSQQLVTRGMDAVYSQSAECAVRYGLIDTDLTGYISQVGLQGYLCRLASVVMRRFLSLDMAQEVLQLGCSLLMAAVACGIVWLVCRQYGRLLAAAFYAVFCLSPWVVNFARNLYWVEFTWFLPMLAGLFCVAFRQRRRAALLAAFGTVLLKCLCGYEFISSVMLGLILFPVIEWCGCLARGDKENARDWFWGIFRLGCAALAGFAVALCLHGWLRGDGNVLAGLRAIFEEDVLRRTFGGDAAVFGEEYRAAMETSVWQVAARYFDFNTYYSTQVLLGMDGNLFVPLVLCAAAAALWLSKEEKDPCNLALYLFSALIPLSWFILAKDHSYVHVHMNFVLWYMGFVPVCLYLIAKAALYGIRRLTEASSVKEFCGRK